MEIRRGMIIRGQEEDEVVQKAAELLQTGEYDPCLAPTLVKGVMGAGPLMMIVLECKAEKT